MYKKLPAHNRQEKKIDKIKKYLCQGKDKRNNN